MDLPRLTGINKEIRDMYLSLDNYFHKIEKGGILIWVYSPDLNVGITRKEVLLYGITMLTSEIKQENYKKRTVKIILTNKPTETRAEMDYCIDTEKFSNATISKNGEIIEIQDITLKRLEQIIINESKSL